jgi:hypothetical protein
MASTKATNSAAPALRKLARQFPQWAAQALNEEAEETMTKAKAITPVSPGGGRLRDSGRVWLATPKDLTALLTFSTDYAIYVHEIPAPPDKSKGGRSATHKPPTQWKYLETPVNALAPTFSQRIASKIQRKLKSSGV